jgi:biotin operon repressor
MVELDKIYGDQHFSMGYKKVNNATHWVNSVGEKHVITPHFKIMYNYILDQYRSYNRQGKPYYESQQAIADNLGMSYDHVKKNLVPLLKTLGLIKIEKVHHKRYVMTVYTPPKALVAGKFINEKLNPKDKKVLREKSLTEDEYKNYRNNQNKIELLERELLKLRQNLFKDNAKKVGFKMKKKVTNSEE